MQEREREREQKLINGITGGLGILILFTIGSFLVAKDDNNWIPFIFLLMPTGLLLFWATRKISKTSKLSKEIESYKKQIKNLENSIR